MLHNPDDRSLSDATILATPRRVKISHYRSDAMPDEPPKSQSSDFARLEKAHLELKQQFDAFVAERQREEVKRLRTALIIAGGVVSALATFVWVEVVWPAVKSIRGHM